VLGREERLVAGQAAVMAGNLGAVAGHDHLVQGDPDVDPAADETRVDHAQLPAGAARPDRLPRQIHRWPATS
jgi:hypothetical protein